MTAPISGTSPVPATASVESRVFTSEAVAAEAYAVLESVIGTDEGRQCIADAVFGALGEELPEGASVEYQVTATRIPAGDFGAAITYTIELQGQSLGVFVDLVAHRNGDCTVFGTFQSFQEPFPAELAADLVDAAATA